MEKKNLMKDSYLYYLLTNHSPNPFEYLRGIGALLVTFILTTLYLWLLSPPVQTNSLDAVESQVSWRSLLNTTRVFSNSVVRVYSQTIAIGAPSWGTDKYGWAADKYGWG